MADTRLDNARIRAARDVTDPVFLGTPLFRCESWERGLGCAVSIKLETANPVRSFKGRGAEVATSRLAEAGSTELMCASAGNLGQALAWSGRRRGIGVTVWAARSAPVAELDRARPGGRRGPARRRPARVRPPSVSSSSRVPRRSTPC